MKKIILAVALLISISGLNELRSQTKPMAKPEILQKIMSWKGDWEANITSKMGDKVTNFVYHINWSVASDGNAVLGKEWMDVPGMGKMSATHLVGYNMDDNRVHWFTVDNMGGSMDQMTEMTGDNKMRISYSGKRGGKSTQTTADLVLKNNNTVEFNLVAMTDGKTDRTMMGTFMRKSSK